MAGSSATTRRVLGLVVALGIGVALLAILLFAGRVWWDALRGPGASPPAELAAAAGTASINLAWDKSPGPNVTGYRIKYGTQRGVYTESMTVGDQASATLSNLNNATTYYIVAVAIDVRGDESPPSNEIEVLTAK